LYLGRVYRGTEVPWHYFTVHLLATTPVAVLALVGVAMTGVAALRSRPAIRQAAVLAAVWCGVLVAVELVSASRYDGIRHFLMILPGIAVLAAVGCDVLWHLADRASPVRGARVRRGVTVGLIAVAGWQVAVLVRLHPYPTAYLNEVTNACLPGPADEWFEVEFWGHAYREGAEWLNANAEPDATVIVPGTLLANYYLDRPAVTPDQADFFAPGPQPRYAMFITRWAIYAPAVRTIATTFPVVFQVRRQNATLLMICRNPPPCDG
jgi:hypothetical protein